MVKTIVNPDNTQYQCVPCEFKIKGMERFRFFYIFDTLDEDRIDPWYWISAKAALELENYLHGNPTEFSSFNMVKELIRRNIIPGKVLDDTYLGVPVLTFLETLKKHSDKELRYSADYALEMRLLHKEMSSDLNEERAMLLRDFCIDLSSIFLRNEYKKSESYQHGLVA